MRVAITREVSPGIGACELTHLERHAIDYERACLQHRAYEECLASLQCKILSLPAEPDLPDSVFVEDAAVVLRDAAVITPPGAESRRHETVGVAATLEPYRELVRIETPGTLEGGDVLVLDRHIFVGISTRTNESGFQQLRSLVSPMGYDVTDVPIRDCLHLKSAVTRIGTDTLLLNRDWVAHTTFSNLRLIDVHPAEPSAANALVIGETVVFPAAFERTMRRIVDAGIEIRPVDVSELAKAEGGVTCCSLIFEA